MRIDNLFCYDGITTNEKQNKLERKRLKKKKRIDGRRRVFYLIQCNSTNLFSCSCHFIFLLQNFFHSDNTEDDMHLVQPSFADRFDVSNLGAMHVS